MSNLVSFQWSPDRLDLGSMTAVHSSQWIDWYVSHERQLTIDDEVTWWPQQRGVTFSRVISEWIFIEEDDTDISARGYFNVNHHAFLMTIATFPLSKRRADYIQWYRSMLLRFIQRSAGVSWPDAKAHCETRVQQYMQLNRVPEDKLEEHLHNLDVDLETDFSDPAVPLVTTGRMWHNNTTNHCDLVTVNPSTYFNVDDSASSPDLTDEGDDDGAALCPECACPYDQLNQLGQGQCRWNACRNDHNDHNDHHHDYCFQRPWYQRNHWHQGRSFHHHGDWAEQPQDWYRGYGWYDFHTWRYQPY